MATDPDFIPDDPDFIPDRDDDFIPDGQADQSKDKLDVLELLKGMLQVGKQTAGAAIKAVPGGEQAIEAARVEIPGAKRLKGAIQKGLVEGEAAKAANLQAMGMQPEAAAGLSVLGGLPIQAASELGIPETVGDAFLTYGGIAANAVSKLKGSAKLAQAGFSEIERKAAQESAKLLAKNEAEKITALREFSELRGKADAAREAIIRKIDLEKAPLLQGIEVEKKNALFQASRRERAMVELESKISELREARRVAFLRLGGNKSRQAIKENVAPIDRELGAAEKRLAALGEEHRAGAGLEKARQYEKQLAETNRRHQLELDAVARQQNMAREAEIRYYSLWRPKATASDDVGKAADAAQNKLVDDAIHPPAPPAQSPIDEAALAKSYDQANTPKQLDAFNKDLSGAHRSVMEEAKRGKMDDGEFNRLALDSGLTYDELTKFNKGTILNVEDTRSAHNELRLGTAKLWESIKGFAAGSVAQDDALKAYAKHVLALARFKGIRSETGRALGHGLLKGNLNEAQMVEAVTKALGGKPMSADIMKKLASLTPDNIRGINQLIQQSMEATAIDKVKNLWINGMVSLSAVPNLIGNSLQFTYGIAKRFGAGALQAARRVPLAERDRFAGEALAMAHGATHSLKTAAGSALETLLTGIPSSATKIEVPRKVRQAFKGKAGTLINVPTRLLEATDDFFNILSYSAEANALAFRESIKRGVPPQLRPEYIKSFIEKLPPSFNKKAREFAEYQTFREPVGPLGKSAFFLKDQFPAADFILPFVTSPVNLVKRGAEMFPITGAPQFLSRYKAGNLKGGQIDDALVTLGAGGIAAGAVFLHAMDGKITGYGPSDPALRSAWMAAGNKPYSIMINGRWRPYSRWEPFSTPIAMAADAAQIYSERQSLEMSDAASKIAAAFSRNLTNKTFLQGLTDFLKAAGDPERFGQNWLERMAGSTVPSVVAGLERVADPTSRQTEGPLEAIMARIPGLSKKLPPLRDIWGDAVIVQPDMKPGVGEVPVRRGGAEGFAEGLKLAFPTFASSKPTDDFPTQELVRLGVRVGSPSRNLGEGLMIRLSPEEYDTYSEISGKTARVRILQLMESAGYDKIPDFAKIEAITKIFNGARSDIRDQLFGKKIGEAKAKLAEERRNK